MAVTLTGFYSPVQAQSISKDGEEIATVSTAVPFLRIIPDARSGGMGDVGLAISPDANAQFHNIAKLAFADKDLGIAVTYTPWLRALVNDIYMAYLSGFKRIDDMQTIGMSLKFFSLGDITFTDYNGNETGQFRPHEFALDASYARKLGENFSTGLALRFIYSNLASGQHVQAIPIKAGIAAAADIGFYYNKPIEIGDRETKLGLGLVISNVGSKITYTESAEKDFLPGNLGFGAAWEFNFDDFNQINIAADINKLLVPSPDSAGTHRTKSVAAGIFGSFSDAENGGKEEMQELMYSTGIEYWYDQQFAVRVGYFHEHALKGNRKFFTAGIGLKYSVFGLDFSYLIPTTNQRNPLDNTLRFTLKFDFDAFKKNQEQEDAPAEFN